MDTKERGHRTENEEVCAPEVERMEQKVKEEEYKCQVTRKKREKRRNKRELNICKTIERTVPKCCIKQQNQ